MLHSHMTMMGMAKAVGEGERKEVDRFVISL